MPNVPLRLRETADRRDERKRARKGRSSQALRRDRPTRTR